MTYNRTNSRAYMQAVRTYVAEWKADYGFDSMAEKFVSEVGWMIERYGFRKAAEYWFSGCVAPAVYESQLFPVIASWRGCEEKDLIKKFENVGLYIHLWNEYTYGLTKILREEFDKEYKETAYMTGGRLRWKISKK